MRKIKTINHLSFSHCLSTGYYPLRVCPHKHSIWCLSQVMEQDPIKKVLLLLENVSVPGSQSQLLIPSPPHWRFPARSARSRSLTLEIPRMCAWEEFLYDSLKKSVKFLTEKSKNHLTTSHLTKFRDYPFSC